MIEVGRKINNYEYKIRIVKWNDRNLMMEDGKYHFGVTNFKDKEIYIANNLKAEAFMNTMIHELIHAYIDSYGLLQIKWDDEIVADFVSTYLENIGNTLEEISKKLEKGRKRYGKRRTRANRKRGREDKV